MYGLEARKPDLLSKNNKAIEKMKNTTQQPLQQK